jgi:hypothetical protein
LENIKKAHRDYLESPARA